MNNGQKRCKSHLATYEKISPNSSKPRNKSIRRFTPHCVMGNLTIESTLGLKRFITPDPKNGASTNYTIGTDGRIGLGVEETNRAWTTSSATNDNEAITVEIANNGGAPDWRMSDAAINAWIDLAVDTAIFYGFKKVNYKDKPADIKGSTAVEAWISSWAKDDEMIITLHCWYSTKVCPGPYFIRQLPWLVKEINKRLSGEKQEAFVGEGNVPNASTGVVESYLITINVPALNVRKGPGTNYPVVTVLMNDKNVYTIVEESKGSGATIWCKLKSGLGWISKNYIREKR